MKSATCFDNDFEPSISCGTNVYPISREVPRRAFLTVSWLLFAVCAMVTVLWCNSMSAMGEMPMPGGWTMSMTWMRMPGQSWLETTALFLAMWVVMMAAMMLPSLVPMLGRYPRAVGWAGEWHLGRLTAVAGLGYFFVWTLLGLAIFPLGVALAALEMRQPGLAGAVPAALGAVILIAGAIQFTSWKARHLACCRVSPGLGDPLFADTGSAWRRRPVARDPLRELLCQSNGNPFGDWGHGSTRNGCRDGGHYPRTDRTGKRARRASHRGRSRRGGVVTDRANGRAWIGEQHDFTRREKYGRHRRQPRIGRRIVEAGIRNGAHVLAVARTGCAAPAICT